LSNVTIITVMLPLTSVKGWAILQVLVIYRVSILQRLQTLNYQGHNVI